MLVCLKMVVVKMLFSILSLNQTLDSYKTKTESLTGEDTELVRFW